MMKAMQCLFVFIIITNLSACSIYRYEEDYKGRILDADTKLPIEGVVVLAVWYKEVFPAEASQVYDAKETLTDVNGEFFIPGMRRLILSNIEYAYIKVFKAGYSDIGLVPFVSVHNDKRILHDNIKWEGDCATIYIKKLTPEERRKRSVTRIGAPNEKQQLLKQEIDRDKKETGQK
jgi:hypothetical protein